jgi:hypothetical protein
MRLSGIHSLQMYIPAIFWSATTKSTFSLPAACSLGRPKSSSRDLDIQIGRADVFYGILEPTNIRAARGEQDSRWPSTIALKSLDPNLKEALEISKFGYHPPLWSIITEQC